jgi:hypothetical protein
MALDAKNGNHRWAEAIKTEMLQLDDYRTFEDFGTDMSRIPTGHKRCRVHFVFDCKYDLRRKARLVADGHRTEDPDDSVYSGIASLRSIRICLFLAELNEMTTVAADVGSAYLEAYI